MELASHERERPRVLSSEERSRLGTLAPDLATIWTAATTTARDRKELLGTLIEEVIVKVERDKSAAHLTLRWKGGALTEIKLGPAALASGNGAHRRGYGRARATTGDALPRHRDRWHPQSARPQNRARPSLRGQSRVQLAHPLEDSLLRPES